MKILMINHFPLVGSGSGTYTRNIAVCLQKKGHEVSVVLPENTADFEKVEGIKIYPVFFKYEEDIEGMLPFNFPCFTTHPRSVMTFKDLTGEQFDQYMNAFEAAINRAVAEFKPDIIHGQHIWLLSWLATKTGLPYVVTAHGTDLMGYTQVERYRRYAEETARGAKAIVTISNDNNDLVGEIFPDCAAKAIYIQNGYDTDRFFPEPISREEIERKYKITLKSKLAIFVGKLAHFKGADVFIEALSLYEKTYPGELTALIAGDGELAPALKRQAYDAGLKDLHFLGHLGAEQLRGLYSSADVSVFPSRREPFGLVAIEALACGSSIIGTNQGGLRDIINNRVGSLVEVEDATGLADALRFELYHPSRAERGRAAAKYAFDNYAQISLIDRLIDIYKS